jgi:4-oxalocrotonate tautomerase
MRMVSWLSGRTSGNMATDTLFEHKVRQARISCQRRAAARAAHAVRYARRSTKGQKKELIAKVTQAMIEVEGENMRPVTWVRINEFESGDWAIGGKPLRRSDVQALAAGKAA